MKLANFENSLFTIIVTIYACTCVPIIVHDKNLGRKFDGIGAISGGGATSKLLVNYKQDQLTEILDFLFKPNFGASLQLLKVEIGGDGQSSEGTESSHMHEEWDENYSRGYEWWIMTEAKKRNPSIKLYGLPWALPGWLSNGDTFYPYKYPNKTATYITKWILGAKHHYNLDIDYIGIWNEKPYDINYIQILRAMLDENQLTQVKIVAADMINSDSWVIAEDLLKYAKFNKSVDIVGGHYTGTWTTPDAQKCGKPLWASEDWSAPGDTEIGAGCLARIINQNYVNGLMTSTIAWNLITAYYDNIYADRHGLMMANEPWSGHYEVTSTIWAAAHTTQFTDLDWFYLDHGSGVGFLPGGGSMVTLVSPSRKNYTIIIETMDVSMYGFCLNPPQGTYKVQNQNVTLILQSNMAEITGFNVWWTKLGLGKEDSVYFKHLGFKKTADASVSLELEVNSIYTLTTLNVGYKGTVSNIPPSSEFPRKYSDDFNSYKEFKEPYYLTPQVGVFEVRKSMDKDKKDMVVRQVVQQSPIFWCPFPQLQPLAIIGNYSWYVYWLFYEGNKIALMTETNNTDYFCQFIPDTNGQNNSY